MAVPVLNDVAYAGLGGSAQYNVSGDGTLVYRRSGALTSSGLGTIQWVDATGKKELLRVKLAEYFNPRLAPDGKRLAFQMREGGRQDIWVYDLQRDAMRKLTSGGGPYWMPVWSPDGRHLRGR